MSDSGATARVRAPRDPEGRKRAIVEAAADLMIESGVADLTHRKIAARADVPLGSTTHYFASLEDLKEQALEFMASAIDAELAELARELAAAEDWQGTLVRQFHGYLGDEVRVRTDATFLVVATENPALRPLATRWFDGLVETLTAYVSPPAARAIAVFSDGALVHAMLHDRPLSVDDLAGTLSRLTRD